VVSEGGRDAGLAGALEAGGRLDVRDDDRDLAPELAPAGSVDECLQVRSSPADEDADPPHAALTPS
jgi:hypothetical protein